MASEREIDTADGLPWSSQENLAFLLEFIASLEISREERTGLAKAAREFVEKRRPR